MKIFLIIFDSLRKDHTGKTYGNDWIHILQERIK
jgi:hypothetical protein